MDTFKVIIIGSGLAGSLLGNGLIGNDIEVAVYERLQRHGKREGYQIRLGSHALVGMRACLTPEQTASIAAKFGRAGGVKSAAPICYNKDFKKLIDLTVFPAYSKSAPINRGLLRDALADPVDKAGKLTYDRKFTRYEIMKPGTSHEHVRVWFEDGGYDDCDVLIGADGSHSKVNVQLGLANIHQVGTHLSMIAKSDLPTEKFLTLSAPLRAAPVLTFADNKTMYFAAYIPDKLTRSAKMTANELDFDDKLSSCMFGFHIPLSAAPANAMELSQDEKWEQLVVKNFAGWAEEYQEIIKLVKNSDLYVYKARVSERPPKAWRAKVSSPQEPERGHPRVWLMGDAMHAMLPNRGMGGNTAMRDTATVLPLLKELAETKQAAGEVSTSRISQACQDYENEMIPRSFEWVQKSGGSKIVPVDSSTFLGGMFFFFAGYAMQLAYLWTRILAVFQNTKVIDDAPELRD